MSTSVYLRDKDRVITWALSAVSAVSLSMGAWFFSGLTSRMDALAEAVVDLRVQVATSALQAQRLEELREELRAHKRELNHPAGVMAIVTEIEKRVSRLEDR